MKTRLFSSLLLSAVFLILISSCGKKTETGMADTVSGGGGNQPPGQQPDSSCTVYHGNQPAAEFSFLKQPLNGSPVDTASPNGNTAWFGFTSITNPPPTNLVNVKWTNPTSVNSFAVLYAPAASASAPFPTCTSLIDSQGIVLPPGARSIIVPVYKSGTTGANWVPFDSVSYTPYSPTSIYYGSGTGAINGVIITATYKSKDGTKTASVTITIVGTSTGPELPPNKH
jgi:hypothetical protein